MKKLLAACLLALSFSVGATEWQDTPKPTPIVQKSTDSWTTVDKGYHLAGGFAIASAATLYTKNPYHGFYWGCGAGVIKEALDSMDTINHTVSGKDLVVTCLGAAMGAAGTNWLITRQGDKNYVTYSYRFK